ncbi:MAG: class I SAM-dependent methyltransferase [Actinomycetota bacterium]
MATSLTDDQIRARIDELDRDLGWYQNIDLGRGISTKSRQVWGEDLDHPRRRWGYIEHAVPTDFSGMSVLDVGCNAGFISFEAADRGATDVVGVELKSGYVEQARFCAEVRDQPVDFREMSVYDVAQLDRTFDFVFFVGLLYHCRYIERAVEAVAAVAADTVLCESAIHPDDSEIPLVRHIDRTQYEGPHAAGAARLPGNWHPNMAAMASLFREQGFASVEPVFRDGGRGAVIARR